MEITVFMSHSIVGVLIFTNSTANTAVQQVSCLTSHQMMRRGKTFKRLVSSMKHAIKIRQLKSYESEAISSHFNADHCCIHCEKQLLNPTLLVELNHLFFCLSEGQFGAVITALNTVAMTFVPNKYEQFLKTCNLPFHETVAPQITRESQQETTRPTTPEFKHNLVEELMGIHAPVENEEGSPDSEAVLQEPAIYKPLEMQEDEILLDVYRLNPEQGKVKLRQLKEHLGREKAKLAQIVDQFNPQIRGLAKEVCRTMLSEDLISKQLPIPQQNRAFKPSSIANLKHANPIPLSLNDTTASTQRDYIRQLINKNNLAPASSTSSNTATTNALDLKQSVANLTMPTYPPSFQSPLDINSSLQSSHFPVIQQQQQQLGRKRKGSTEHSRPFKSSKIQEIQAPDHLIQSLLKKTQPK